MFVYRTGQLIRPDLQAHIYSDALISNLNSLRGLTPAGTKFCAVVKANAYGHGILEIVNILKQQDVDFFAVASIYEAIHIAPQIKRQKILILEPVNPTWPAEHIRLCAETGFHCTVSSNDSLDFLCKLNIRKGDVLNLHVNVESGMGRRGMDPEEAEKAVRIIDSTGCLNLAGVFTHFATADEKDLSYAYQQLDNFESFLNSTNLKNRTGFLIHAANSAAAVKMPKTHYSMVRCGISLYGYYSIPMDNPPIQLTPVMEVRAPIVNLKKIPKGRTVSYGCSFTTQRDTISALIPLGYADGYWRCFSNNAVMKLRGSFVPVIGRVCMDQLLVDVTDIDTPKIGELVTLIDRDHRSPCGVYALAEAAGTICYEILTCVHAHVNRVVH